jgi:hypothetical protein
VTQYDGQYVANIQILRDLGSRDYDLAKVINWCVVDSNHMRLALNHPNAGGDTLYAISRKINTLNEQDQLQVLRHRDCNLVFMAEIGHNTVYPCIVNEVLSKLYPAGRNIDLRLVLQNTKLGRAL